MKIFRGVNPKLKKQLRRMKTAPKVLTVHGDRRAKAIARTQKPQTNGHGKVPLVLAIASMLSL